jgi:hypothetical protein
VGATRVFGEGVAHGPGRAVLSSRHAKTSFPACPYRRISHLSSAGIHELYGDPLAFNLPNVPLARLGFVVKR